MLSANICAVTPSHRLLGSALALLLSLTLTTAGALVPAAAAPGDGSITGQIHTQLPGESPVPAAEAHIYVYYSATPDGFFAQLGDLASEVPGGALELTGLPDGYYKLDIAGAYDADGKSYQRESYDNASTLTGATVIHIENGSDHVLDDPVLELPGLISGTITDENGEPLPGASVYFGRVGENGGGSAVITEEDGSYTSHFEWSGGTGLVRGDYQVEVSGPEPADPADLRHVFTTYPTAVPAVPGATVTGIDVQLELSPRVRLTVLGPAGEPIPEHSVDVWIPDTNGTWGPVQYGPNQTDENGVFRQDVRVGSRWRYRITPPAHLAGTVVAQWYDNVYSLDEATVVEPTAAGEVLDLTVQLGPDPDPVTPPAPGSLSGSKPAIKGKPRVGRVLTVRPKAWGPGAVTLTYQWLRGKKPIKGGTGAKYRLRKADVGKRLRVRVTGSKPGFTTLARVSAKTKKVRRR